MDGVIGEIKMFGGDYTPENWLRCSGQELEILKYTSLFSVIGSLYGSSDPQTLFALPDFRGRTPIHSGKGADLTLRPIASQGGSEKHILTSNEMPSHTHDFKIDNNEGEDSSPSEDLNIAKHGDMFVDAGDFAKVSSDTIGNTGGGQPHNIVQPYLTVNFIICFQGEFPNRKGA